MKYVMGKFNICLDWENRSRKGGQCLKGKRTTKDLNCVKSLYILQRDT